MRTDYITCITWAKLCSCLLMLPVSHKRHPIHSLLLGAQALFAQRRLPFDELSSVMYAKNPAPAIQCGRTLFIATVYRAAGASALGAAVATRYDTTFRSAGLAVINPWQVAHVAP